MTSSAKRFLLFLATFLDARWVFSSTRVRPSLLALLLGAFSLFAPAPAVAQTPDPVTNLAAASGDGKLTLTWTNPTFTDGSVYIHLIRWRVQSTTNWLNSGGADGVAQFFTASYEITGLTNDTIYEVEVRIRRGISSPYTYSNWVSTTGTPQLPPPTVSLSVSPNPVWEGSSVTVTARLSRALSANVTIPVTLTDNSAESSDHGTLSSITINSGTTSGTGTISTNHDTDEDNETFTVALGTLPSSVTAGSPPSVQITIRDDEGVQILSVDASPTCGSTVTDMSLHPSYAFELKPAPAAAVSVESRPVANHERGWRSPVLSIGTSGSSGPIARNPFSTLRNAFPGFRGFEFRLANDHSVMAKCEWTFLEQDTRDNDRTFNPALPPSGPTGGGPSPGGGAPPPAVPSDPTPDSPCGESDRVYLQRFYEMTEGEGWDRDDNWNSEELLEEWFGVGTEDGRVISLLLPDNGLSGKMPEDELLCLTELKELALWGNDDLEGEVPEQLVLAVERAALRDIAEALNINPEWFEDCEEPCDFEDWHAGVTTDDEGRVTGLDLTEEGAIEELPESVSQLRRLGEIMITTSSGDGGCALSPEGSSAFSLFLLTLLVFAVLGRQRARG